MSFDKLNLRQIEAVLAARDTILEMPGVLMMEVDFIDPERTEPGVVVYVDVDDRGGVAQLPTAVAGVPVIVKIEDPRPGQVIETIDPRRSRGKWPTSSYWDVDRRWDCRRYMW